MRPFSDLFSDDHAETEDAEFFDVPGPDGDDHKIRSAYLLAAIVTGTLLMALAVFFFI